ncbi:hypothetical protein [Kistimonas asteriae]|nr:hypothetical protein [Kistimonas asteriae]
MPLCRQDNAIAVVIKRYGGWTQAKAPSVALLKVQVQQNDG